jgi:hypothetical protein
MGYLPPLVSTFVDANNQQNVKTQKWVSDEESHVAEIGI